MNILCVIPARGGSKGLRRKNILPFFGKPLIYYTIKAAQESRLVNKIVVSTDDHEIGNVAGRYGVQIIKRPKNYATDSAPIELALRHAVLEMCKKSGFAADIVVWLQANIPIRKKGQVDQVVNKLINSKADTVATVYSVSQLPQWMKKMDKNGFLTPLFINASKYRRQDVEPFFLLDGAIVAMRTKILMGTKGKKGVHVFMGKKIAGVVQDRKYSQEVDDKESLDLARLYFSEVKDRL